MGEKIKPRFSSDFELAPEGLHLFRVKKADVEISEKNVKLFKVESKIEGGDYDGVTQFDNFPLVSRKNFGLERLAGFLVKLKVFPADRPEFDSDIFSADSFEEKFKMIVPEKVFGGKIKHVKSKETGDTMSNIVAYYTVEELQEELKREREGKSIGFEGSVKPTTKSAKETVKDSAKKDEAWI